MTESVADARRVYSQNNYAVPRTYSLSAQIPPDLPLPASGFVLGSESVVLSGNVITTPTTYISAEAKILNTSSPTYRFIGALAQSGTFGLIRNLVDWRPSYI